MLQCLTAAATKLPGLLTTWLPGLVRIWLMPVLWPGGAPVCDPWPPKDAAVWVRPAPGYALSLLGLQHVRQMCT